MQYGTGGKIFIVCKFTTSVAKLCKLKSFVNRVMSKL